MIFGIKVLAETRVLRTHMVEKNKNNIKSDKVCQSIFLTEPIWNINNSTNSFSLTPTYLLYSLQKILSFVITAK